VQTHRNSHQSIAHSLAGSSQDLGNAAMTLHTCMAVFNATTRFGQFFVLLLLCRGQFFSGLSLLFALAFDRCDYHGLAHFKTLKSAIATDGNGGATGESSLIKDLLLLFTAIGFFSCGQNGLARGMRDGDMVLRMALFLPRIRFFLLSRIFRASNGSLRSISENP
jgi:hypothetical protein